MKQLTRRITGVAGTLALAFALGPGATPNAVYSQIVAPERPDAVNGTAFTYQGRLVRNGQPVTETCAVSISL